MTSTIAKPRRFDARYTADTLMMESLDRLKHLVGAGTAPSRAAYQAFGAVNGIATALFGAGLVTLKTFEEVEAIALFMMKRGPPTQGDVSECLQTTDPLPPLAELKQRAIDEGCVPAQLTTVTRPGPIDPWSDPSGGKP